MGSRLGGVYFIRSGAYIKIGVATNVFRRAQMYSLYNPHELTPLGWLHEPEEEAANILERRLHRKFAALRHRGEWFRAAPALTDFIERFALKWPRQNEFGRIVTSQERALCTP